MRNGLCHRSDFYNIIGNNCRREIRLRRCDIGISSHFFLWVVLFVFDKMTKMVENIVKFYTYN